MAERVVVVRSRVGLHARPAALFVQAASAQPVKVRIRKREGAAVDARSILRVLSLGVKGGDEVVIEADGDGAEAALDALTVVLETDHDVEA
jgi:phosphocarrier protein HPr